MNESSTYYATIDSPSRHWTIWMPLRAKSERAAKAEATHELADGSYSDDLIMLAINDGNGQFIPIAVKQAHKGRWWSV